MFSLVLMLDSKVNILNIHGCRDTMSLLLRHQCKQLEFRLEQGTVLMEFEQVPKRLVGARCDTAQLGDNIERNRFRDVLPYEGNRVKLVPSKDNPTGYINASHIQVCRFSVLRCAPFLELFDSVKVELNASRGNSVHLLHHLRYGSQSIIA